MIFRLVLFIFIFFAGFAFSQNASEIAANLSSREKKYSLQFTKEELAEKQNPFSRIQNIGFTDFLYSKHLLKVT